MATSRFSNWLRPARVHPIRRCPAACSPPVGPARRRLSISTARRWIRCSFRPWSRSCARCRTRRYHCLSTASRSRSASRSSIRSTMNPTATASSSTPTPITMDRVRMRPTIVPVAPVRSFRSIAIPARDRRSRAGSWPWPGIVPIPAACSGRPRRCATRRAGRLTRSASSSPASRAVRCSASSRSTRSCSPMRGFTCRTISTCPATTRTTNTRSPHPRRSGPAARRCSRCAPISAVAWTMMPRPAPTPTCCSSISRRGPRAGDSVCFGSIPRVRDSRSSALPERRQPRSRHRTRSACCRTVPSPSFSDRRSASSRRRRSSRTTPASCGPSRPVPERCTTSTRPSPASSPISIPMTRTISSAPAANPGWRD